MPPELLARRWPASTLRNRAAVRNARRSESCCRLARAQSSHAPGRSLRCTPSWSTRPREFAASSASSVPTICSVAALACGASPTQSAEHRATVTALRSTARRALACEAEAADLESALEVLVTAAAPGLLAERGVGVISAAAILNAWSHPGRLRSEAAFAALAGVAPIPASSGQTVRHRLNRFGDRQLNRALHTIVLSRLMHDAETRAYATRRSSEGRTPREIKRCLKRHLARRLFKLLERVPMAA